MTSVSERSLLRFSSIVLGDFARNCVQCVFVHHWSCITIATLSRSQICRSELVNKKVHTRYCSTNDASTSNSNDDAYLQKNAEILISWHRATVPTTNPAFPRFYSGSATATRLCNICGSCIILSNKESQNVYRFIVSDFFTRDKLSIEKAVHHFSCMCFSVWMVPVFPIFAKLRIM